MAINLTAALDALARGRDSLESLPTSDPFELILWENIAYLAAPAKRRAAFETLQATVGTSAPGILRATAKSLQQVTGHGILPAAFADKLRRCARILLEEFAGDLSFVLRGPTAAARKALRKFPGIGEPGAEKILLFAGIAALPGLDSNGLRVLVRLGLIKEQKSYAKTYAQCQRLAAWSTLTIEAMQRAHLVLQRHGRELCKRTAPKCHACPLARRCPGARNA